MCNIGLLMLSHKSLKVSSLIFTIFSCTPTNSNPSLADETFLEPVQNLSPTYMTPSHFYSYTKL